MFPGARWMDVSWDLPCFGRDGSTVELEAKFRRLCALVIYEPPKINSRNLKFTARKNEKDTIESESNLQFGFQHLNFQGCIRYCFTWSDFHVQFFFVSYIDIWSLGGAWDDVCPFS